MPDPSPQNSALPPLDPQPVASQLSAKLASRSRHVCLFLGAGASCAAGLPDLKGLQDKVRGVLPEPSRTQFDALLVNRTLEDGLSRLRRIRSLLAGDATFDTFTSGTALALDEQICAAIVSCLDISRADLGPASNLAIWAGRNTYALPIEIFTINYDTLIEAGLEKHGVPYFDGFIGNMRARFRSDLVDIAEGDSTLPPSFIRLWKLHGSTHWATDSIDGHKEVIRLGAPATNGQMAAIYPSDEKYADSRRVPFVVLLDRFRRALEVPETIVVVSGYSFGDQHLNELLFDAARRRPRSEIVSLFRGAIPPHVVEKARQLRNLTVLGGDMAIIGGDTHRWESRSTISGIWNGTTFQLGDFRLLTEFLARTGGVANG